MEPANDAVSPFLYFMLLLKLPPFEKSSTKGSLKKNWPFRSTNKRKQKFLSGSTSFRSPRDLRRLPSWSNASKSTSSFTACPTENCIIYFFIFYGEDVINIFFKGEHREQDVLLPMRGR